MADQLLLDTSGRVVPVPSEQVGDALSLGFVPATQQQIDNFNLTQKYGTTGQQVLTGLESAGSALTLGGSTWLERAAGVDPQDIAGREQTNPTASAIGTGIGIAAPLIFSGGLAAPEELAGQGLLRTAAKFTAPSLLARAGEAVTEGVGEALPKATGLIGKIGTAIAPAAAGSAIEGAGYGLGQVVHESALGDPALTAESALAQVGLSTLMGGAFGAGTGAAKGVLEHLAGGSGSFAKIADKLSDWAEDYAGERGLKATFAKPVDIEKVINRQGWDGAMAMGRAFRDRGYVTPFSTAAKVVENASTDLLKSSEAIGQMLSFADEGEKPDWETLLINAYNKVLAPLSEDPTKRAAASEVSKDLEQYELMWGKKAPSWTDIHDAETSLGEQSFGFQAGTDPLHKQRGKAFAALNRLFSDFVDDGVASQGVDPRAWSSANKTFQVSKLATDLANSGMKRGLRNNHISLTELLSGLTGFATHGPIGGLMGTAGAVVARRFGSAALGAATYAGANALESVAKKGVPDALLDTLGNAGHVGQDVALGLGAKALKPDAQDVANQTGDLIQAQRLQGQSDSIARQASSDPATIDALATLERNNQRIDQTIHEYCEQLIAGGKQAEAQAVNGLKPAEFPDFADKLNGLVNQPGVMVNHMASTIADSQEHAPQTSQALQVTLGTALSFLQSKLPARQKQGLLGAEPKVSKAELAKFNRYYSAVNDPLSVLKHPTPEGIETIQAVYPHLLDKAKANAVGHLINNPDKRPTYQTRLKLGSLLGEDVDGSIGAAASIAASGTIPPPPKMQPHPMPGAGKLTLANRTSLGSDTKEA